MKTMFKTAYLGVYLFAAALSTPALAQSHDAKAHDAMNHGAMAQHGVTVTGAWARPTIAKLRISAAYFTAMGDKEDKLIAAHTDIAGRAELHEHVMQGDIAKMRPVAAVPLAPGNPAVFQPGGYHVMIMDLKQPLKEGDTFPLTLTFEKAGDVTVTVEVMKKPTSHGAHGGMDHGTMHK